jgi:hypothetical protein
MSINLYKAILEILFKAISPTAYSLSPSAKIIPNHHRAYGSGKGSTCLLQEAAKSRWGRTRPFCLAGPRKETSIFFNTLTLLAFT